MMNGSQQDRSITTRFFEFVAREAPKFVSFGLVGVVNALVNYVITVGLTLGVLIPFGLGASDGALGIIKAIGWAVAVSNSYVLNTLTTFAAESGRRLAWPTYGRFVASGTLGLVVEVLSFLVAVRYLPLTLAAIVPIGFAFVTNFAMTRLVVFPGSKSPDDTIQR
ncbi:GtrA family protein [Phreatobacter stygius]|nr:GtrA family protein [Phreatobacter stygius]